MKLLNAWLKNAAEGEGFIFLETASRVELTASPVDGNGMVVIQ